MAFLVLRFPRFSSRSVFFSIIEAARNARESIYLVFLSFQVFFSFPPPSPPPPDTVRRFEFLLISTIGVSSSSDHSCNSSREIILTMLCSIEHDRVTSVCIRPCIRRFVIRKLPACLSRCYARNCATVSNAVLKIRDEGRKSVTRVMKLRAPRRRPQANGVLQSLINGRAVLLAR